MDMSDTDLDAECAYRYAERLGILCEDGEPTPAQKAIARAEVMRYRISQI